MCYVCLLFLKPSSEIKKKINKKNELNYQTSCLSACLQMSVNCFVMKNPKFFFLRLRRSNRDSKKCTKHPGGGGNRGR